MVLLHTLHQLLVIYRQLFIFSHSGHYAFCISVACSNERCVQPP